MCCSPTICCFPLYFPLFGICMLWAGGILPPPPPPVNPNGKRSLVAQAFAVVIIGLCKFNIKWAFISIVKIWSKTYTSRRSTLASQYFWRMASVLQAGKFFWRSACADGSMIGSCLPLSCIMYTSSGRNHRV
jgi:hypothetical protein